MRPSMRLAVLGLAAVALYLLSAAGLLPRLRDAVIRSAEDGRMTNVTISAPEATPDVAADAMASAAVTPVPEPSASQPMEPASDVYMQPVVSTMDSGAEEEVRETTIQGGLTIKNETAYQVDARELLSLGPQVTLPAGQPQILIIHTHGSEAYTQAGLDRYEANDNNRTSDTEFNIIRVGDELTSIFQASGLNVIHDREIYDYPSYTGSYTRSGAAVESYLSEYPSIAMVIDLHRDALGSGDVVYKTMAEEDGVCASQVMLLVGSDESGLDHPNWRSNLSLALYLQQAVDRAHPTLMRPVSLVRQRYNQHLTPGSMIIEVGSSGNTLREALAAIRLFGEAAAPALLELVESGEATPY